MRKYVVIAENRRYKEQLEQLLFKANSMEDAVACFMAATPKGHYNVVAVMTLTKWMKMLTRERANR